MKNASEQSRIHRPYYRNGDNHRADSDVSFNDIRKVFGFRSIKVGKWVSAKEQQLAANLLTENLDMKVYQIGEFLGYNQSSSFIDVFKQTYAMTPSQYRKENHLISSNEI